MPSLAFPIAFILALGAANPSEEFETGRNAFLRGEYVRAITLLHPLLYPDLRLNSEDEVVQTHRMLGVAYLFENQPDHARSEFRKLLELDPDFHFDPFLDPPRVVEFFQGVVRQQREELGDIETRLKKREAELSKRANVVIERRIEHRSYALNYYPFGVGQFQNGERRKGLSFLIAESALAATSIGAFAINFAVYGPRPYRSCLDMVSAQPNGSPGFCPTDRIDHTGEDRSRNLTRLQVISGGLFFATAIWGIIDSLRHFQSEISLDETTVPPQIPTATSATKESQSNHFFAPALVANSPGAMLSLIF